MNIKGTKIGYGQLAAVLVLLQLAKDMTETENGTGYTMEHFFAIFCAYLIMLILFVPLIVFTHKTENENVISSLIKNNKALGAVSAFLFAVVLILTAADGMNTLCKYTETTLLYGSEFYLLIILIAAVSVYGAAKGIEAIMRSGSIIAFITAVFFTITIIAVAFKMDWSLLYPSLIDDQNNFFDILFKKLSMLPNVIVFAVMTKYVDKFAHRSALWFNGISFIAAEFSALMYITVLGPFLDIVEYPFHTVASMSDVVLLQRLDGIDSAIWMLCSLVRIALYIFCAGDLLTELFGKRIWCVLVCGAVTTALSALFGKTGFELSFIRTVLPAIITLVVVIVTISALICDKGGKRNEKINVGD